MTKSETAKLLAYIAVAYPHGKVEPNEPTVNLWSKFTDDLTLEQATLAVDSMIATLKYPPSIADIREAVAKAQAESRGDLTAGEALAKLRRALSRYGYYDPTGARECLGERIWEVMRMVGGGWGDLCISEDENWPARFERLYKEQATREQYVAQIPAPVMDRLKQLGAGQMLKQIGGRSDG